MTMATPPRWFRAARAVLPDGVREAVAFAVADGRIVEIRPAAGVAGAEPLGEGLVLPGLVDPHVHVNEPGRTAWEGFATATRAAAAGGITTLVDMPLNAVPAATTAAALHGKRSAAAGQCHVDVACWGGVVPGNAGEIEALADAGVRGFKCFMSPSGVAEFAHVTESDLADTMPVVARTGLPLLVHAEWPALLATAPGDPCAYATWLASRPPAAEVEAIRRVLALAEATRCRVHIVHLATPDALPLFAAARARGVTVTVETCPHYLTFAAGGIPDRATAFKCAPPIRAAAACEGLWQALDAGAIDLVASDHSPCPPAMKRAEDGDFMQAWGGIASLELSLAAVWTGAAARGFGIERVAEWMAAAPARLAGLAGKGALAVGRDADFVRFDPDAEWRVDQHALHQRHPLTPYHGRTLRGQVRATWLRGERIFDGAGFAAPRGRLVTG
jgi:allantoinase